MRIPLTKGCSVNSKKKSHYLPNFCIKLLQKAPTEQAQREIFMCLRLAEVKLSRQLVVSHICVGIYLSENLTPTIITQAFGLEMFSQVKHFKKPDHLYKERKLTTDPKVVSVPFCLLSEVLI